MTFSKNILEFKLKCNKIRTLIMYMIHNSGSGHPGPSLSCVEIIMSLFDYVLNHNKKLPLWEDRDRFILSKGHAAPTLYAVLSMEGYIDEKELRTLRKSGSRLQGHPDMTMLDCIEFSTGSLGKGISASTGIAEALRLKANCTTSFRDKQVCSRSMPRVFVLIGDGELDEGITKESLSYIGAKKLSNMVLIIDNNGHQLSGKKENILNTNPIENHFNDLQWNIITRYKESIDLSGHDYTHIRWAFDQITYDNEKPTVIIFKTIKGKGVPFMEDDAAFHGMPPKDHELRALTSKYIKACKSLDNHASEKGIFDIYNTIMNNRINEYDKQSNIKLEIKEKLSPRDSVGKSIANEAVNNDKIVSIHSDLMSSCKGDYFHKLFPERCLEVGIAENLMNMLAGGLAKEGFIPFTNTFSIFQLEAMGALRQIAYNNLNVKVMGSHGDPRLKDGGSHSEIELLPALRGMPNWNIFWPSDGVLAYKLIPHLIGISGPCFMKYSRNKVPTIYNSKIDLPIPVNNKLTDEDIHKGYIILKDFDNSSKKKKKTTVFAVGEMVYDSITAISDFLRHYDMDIRLIDLFRLKPVDKNIIISSAEKGPIISAEASNINGGLYGLISEIVSLHHPAYVFPIAVNNEFIKSGDYEELTEKHNIGHENIANALIKAYRS